MELKFIKLNKKAKPKNVIDYFKEEGYNCVKFSVDRRYLKKQKVMGIIRNHKKYKENFQNMLVYEGFLSLMNRKDFWIGSPDYIIWNDDNFYFCEFKSYKDTFRINQIEWFEKFKMLPLAIAIAVKSK